jgi:two-component system LytT family response regulator
MTEVKAIIVEDNAFMAAVLLDMLKKSGANMTVVAIASSGKEALEQINAHKPDIVFLDIELSDMTGFEMLSQLSEIRFNTIFTTAHSQYAIQAFRFNALDYLIKPIKEAELKDALSRVGEKDSRGIKNALHNLEAESLEEQRLVLPTQSATHYFPLGEITHMEGDRNYTFIYLVDGSRELSSKNLAYFEDVLGDKGFFRCHRSYLVNRAQIEVLKKDCFSLKIGLEIPISRRKKAEASKWLSEGSR